MESSTEDVRLTNPDMGLLTALCTNVEMARGAEMPDEARTARRGLLKNGNTPGDLSKAVPCGAKTRCGTPCQGPGMANGRCRTHGGTSTGPRTDAGIEAIRRSRTVHGYYSQQALAARQAARGDRQLLRDLLRQLV